MNKLRHCRALFALVALSLICGDNWVVMKVALAHSLDFAGLRTLLGALVLFVVLLWGRGAAWVQLGEAPVTHEAAGMLLIGIALVVVSVRAMRDHLRISLPFAQSDCARVILILPTLSLLSRHADRIQSAAHSVRLGFIFQVLCPCRSP